MPHYYCHLTAGSMTEMDVRGITLAGDEEAITEVTAAVHELRAEFSTDDWTGWALQVMDVSGRHVLDLPLDLPLEPLRGGFHNYPWLWRNGADLGSMPMSGGSDM